MQWKKMRKIGWRALWAMSALFGGYCTWYFGMDMVPTEMIRMGLAGGWVLLLIALWRVYGMRWIGIYLLVWVMWLALESVAQYTCVPYGCFSYGNLLGPTWWGNVPILLLVIRPVIVLGIRNWVEQLDIHKLVSYVVISALLYVSVDLVLDPVHVYHGVWSYSNGDWLDVPVSNYIGWLIISVPFALGVRKSQLRRWHLAGWVLWWLVVYYSTQWLAIVMTM